MRTEKNVGEKTERPKYVINIEGIDHEWSSEFISPADVRLLAGFSATEPIIEVDLKDNSERTLAEDDVVQLRPGVGFGKKIQFKRG